LFTGAVKPSLTDILFFGCRSSSCDFYYGDQLQAYVLQQQLLLSTAFSRDQNDKVYVTHRLREFGREVWDRIEAGASIFVAGSAKRMPVDVMKAIKDIIQSQGHLDDKEAENFLAKLVSTKRYCVESWS